MMVRLNGWHGITQEWLMKVSGCHRHEHARRIQLVQTSERDFEVRIDLADEAVPKVVFEEVTQSVKRVFLDNGLEDVTVTEGQAPPEFTASGKFHEVLPLRGSIPHY